MFNIHYNSSHCLLMQYTLPKRESNCIIDINGKTVFCHCFSSVTFLIFLSCMIIFTAFFSSSLLWIFIWKHIFFKKSLPFYTTTNNKWVFGSDFFHKFCCWACLRRHCSWLGIIKTVNRKKKVWGENSSFKFFREKKNI